MRQLKIKMHGEVQGVGMRIALRAEAKRQGLVGWVTNAPDGTVEALSIGNEAALKELLGWAERGGGFTTVSGVEADWQEVTEDFAEYAIV